MNPFSSLFKSQPNTADPFEKANTPSLSMLPCLGAIIGDTVGSIYEIHNIKKTDFPLFISMSRPTDDSVMTIAVADWLINDPNHTQLELEAHLLKWGFRYPDAGYGPAFKDWLFYPYYKNMDLYAPRIEAGETPEEVLPTAGLRRPYWSWGNGSAMRCSACGWVARSIEEAIALGRQSAIITHNNPEGLRGAEAVSAAIFLARTGNSKDEIRDFIEQRFYYDLHMDCDEIRPSYEWEASCQGTVPPAIVAFLDSYDFESAIRLAVSLGGDSDTLACITGGIAHAFYQEIPDAIIQEMSLRLPKEFWDIMAQLESMVFK